MRALSVVKNSLSIQMRQLSIKMFWLECDTILCNCLAVKKDIYFFLMNSWLTFWMTSWTWSRLLKICAQSIQLNIPFFSTNNVTLELQNGCQSSRIWEFKILCSWKTKFYLKHGRDLLGTKKFKSFFPCCKDSTAHLKLSHMTLTILSALLKLHDITMCDTVLRKHCINPLRTLSFVQPLEWVLAFWQQCQLECWSFCLFSDGKRGV